MAHSLIRLVRWILVAPIVIYQKVISPALPGGCIYTPTCSNYAKEAVLKHGVAGFLLAFARILRCAGGPFTGGHDPVPEEFHFHEISDGYRKFRRKDRKKRGR